MSFVQGGMLAALAALAIPILIHLLFRRKARPVDLGTLQFLKVVLRDTTRRRRLKRYVLLAMRLAAVALIALLFARPYLLAHEPSEGSRLVVVLVDRSASMGLKGGTSPSDRAARELREIVARSGKGTQLELAAFDRAISPIAKPSDPATDALKPGSAGTDYAPAMAWARDVSIRSRAKSRELYILTDLQRSGLDRGESVAMPGDLDVHLTDFGRLYPKNLAVVAVSLSSPTIRPRDSTTVSATVRNASPMPVEKVSVRLHLECPGNEPIDRERAVDVDGNGSAVLAFPLTDLDAGLWRGHVEIGTSDDLPIDDRRYFAMPVSRPARVLLIDGDPGASPIESETFFLRAALRLAPEGETYAKSPFLTTTIAAQSPLPELDPIAVVVLANVGDLPADRARQLAEFVARGGGLVVFTGDRVTAESARSWIDAGLGVGRVLGAEHAADRPFRLESWDDSHPIFRPFADPESGDLRRPTFLAITKVDPEPSSRVLARFRGGAPALIERSVGKGRIEMFASACDHAWGDWPRGRMFLPMVHQIVAQAAGLADGGPTREAMAGSKEIPGIFEENGRLRVVNVDPSESELARCSSAEFAAKFGLRLANANPRVEAPRAVRSRADDRLRPDELWPWIALGLIGLLMLESLLANRTSA